MIINIKNCFLSYQTHDTVYVMTKHLYLIDGSGFIFRAYYGYPQMNRADGTPINAVYGFCVMVNKLIQETDADLVGVIFDSGRTTFRNHIYPAYKANREDPPEDLKPQFSLIRKACEAYNIPSIDMVGYEADDIIATYTKMATEQGYFVSIVSSDKDLMQLVNDKVTLFDAMKNKTIGYNEVIEKFGVAPDKVIDVQSLAGDSSDNVPGVPGIGIKTAALLINTYGNLDNLLACAGEITQNKRRENLINHADNARISRQLVTLHQDVPLSQDLDFFTRREYNPDTLRAFLLENNFKRLLSAMNLSVPENSSTKPTRPQPPMVYGQKIDVSDDLKHVQHKYTCIQDVTTLKLWLAQVYKTKVLAIDTETTGLHIRKAKIVGISLATDVGRACYIPLNHRTDGDTEYTYTLGNNTNSMDDLFSAPPTPKQISVWDIQHILQPILSDPTILKVGHNLKFDMSILQQVGLHLYPADDTMILSFCVDAGRTKHGLDALAKKYLNHTMIAYRDVCGTGRGAKKFDTINLADATKYASEDADITWRLHKILKSRIIAEKGLTIYEDVERKLIPVIVQMEQNGIKVDKTKLAQLSMVFGTYMKNAEKSAMDILGAYDIPPDFNIASPSQLGVVLFDTMAIAGGKKTKTGAYSTSSENLEALDLTEPTHQHLIQHILTYRTYAKLKSTYTDALQDEISPKTQRIHTSFNMVGTITGRLSSSDPNLQNIPVRDEDGKRIRACFVADTHKVILSLDYSQIELRIMAHMANDPVMIQAFADGQDIHRASASKMFGVAMDAVNDDLRRKAKIINFGIIYDVSAFGLARQVGCSRGEASAFIKEYFEQFPNIKHYMEHVKQHAEIDGFVKTLFNRKIHLSGITGSGSARNHAFRQAINAPIQGTSADIIKRAMIRIHHALHKNPIGSMILQVHDELLFETTPKNAEILQHMITDIMQTAHTPTVALKVPLLVEGKIAKNWADAH